MSPNDDDLSAFHDDPLFRALTAPGSGDELAGQAEALAAFQAAVRTRRGRRYGRLGVAGSAVGIAVVLSGATAAAAANGVFPAPVQNAAHDVLGPILKPVGIVVPAATSGTSPATDAGRPASVTSTLPTLPSAPVAAPTPVPVTRHPRIAPKPTHKPRPHAKPTATPIPASTPTSVATPTATPSPTPTPTNTSPVPSDSITISLSSTTVTPGGTVTAYGQLADSSGNPISGQNVWLLEHVAGQAGVSEVAAGTTGGDGSVSFASPALARNAWLRLVTGTKVKSAAITVIVEPSITVTVTPGAGESSVRLDTDGGNPGDVINVLEHVDGEWQPFVSTQLDDAGGATIGVASPVRGLDHYRVILQRTAAHGIATATFTVSAS